MSEVSLPLNLSQIVRPNVLGLKAYHCARDDYSSGILLDANENPYNSVYSTGIPDSLKSPSPSYHLPLNRYPDPHQDPLKAKWADYRQLPSSSHLFLGVGSDECLDMIMRITCTPGQDSILITPPTYGMYSVCAAMNQVEVIQVPLLSKSQGFQLNMKEVEFFFPVFFSFLETSN